MFYTRSSVYLKHVQRSGRSINLTNYQFIKTMMKNIFFLFLFLLATQCSIAQNAAAFYKTGDSLYKIKEYKNAAIAYAAGIREEGKAATINRYWVLASRWVLAGETDSALHYLTEIAQSDKTNRVQAKGIDRKSVV